MNKSTKKATVYDFILNKLMTCQYRFGEKVPVKKITEETGISRQPIMSALSNLQERGFVEITAQVGCTVSKPSSQEVFDFYKMFAANEGLVAAFAAERGTDDEFQRLEAINEKIRDIKQLYSDIDQAYRQLNDEFHHQLHRMARSPLVSRQQMANFELSDFFIVQSCGFKAHLVDAADEHREIIKALKGGDSQGARAAAIAHIDSVARDVFQAMRER